MLSYKRISLFITVFCFLFVIMMGLNAHRSAWHPHDAKIPHLEFKSDPKVEITCNIPDKKVFTYSAQTDSNGNVITATESWDEEPPNPVVTINAEAHGLGWAHILLYGNIDGKKKGDPKKTVDDRLGNWAGFFPLGWGDGDHPISWSFGSSFTKRKKKLKKEYKWDGSGSVKLVPMYFKWGLSGIIPGGSWERADEDFQDDGNDSADGSWEVKHNLTPIPPNATAPSPPQSISVSPGWRNGQIDLTWTKSADDGGTPITDYEYQYAFYFQAYRGADAYWDWTPWRSAGKDMTETIMGGRMKTEFRVQMRAVNVVGESVSTNYETVTTR